MERKIRHTSSPATPAHNNNNNNNSNGPLIALRYEESAWGKPPIPVTVAPPRDPPTDTHPALRRPISGMEEKDETKRDSGLAPTTSSKAREGSVSSSKVDDAPNFLGVSINFNSSPTPNPTPATSSFEPPKLEKSDSSGSGSLRKWRQLGFKKTGSGEKLAPDDLFAITTSIPTDSFVEEDFLDKLSFSNRGSIMLGGKKAINGQARLNGGRRIPSFSLLVSSPIVLSDDVELESQKIRSMYESGTNFDWQSGNADSGPHIDETDGGQEEPEEELSLYLTPRKGGPPRPETSLSVRSQHELAGGIEDWEDISGGDVDRYGFISMRRNSRPGTPEPRPGIQRVSTALQLASDTPRRRRTFGRAPSFSASPKGGLKNSPPRKVTARSMKTQNTKTSSMSRQSTRSNLRAAANRLPGNRDRKLMDEAGDMLTLPPGLADIAEDEEGGKAVDDLKKKEWERSEKWRKMAKIIKTGKDGQGMEFEFDARNPKLIERTWKGIPDRWRASAWYSFLSTSAKKRKDSPTDEELIAAFHKLQDQSSADDVQIDIDVPRTINSHIMFRRRYRGGQRLLFRVLHALSLHFPETSYVQGMASLAATLLCYYDEEKTFIMLARMWTLRGLDKLYEAGFPGLMAALDEFEKQWLSGTDVAKKLDELNIELTAYGTRWYLTLFNYSIPFPAQLRVWDVFMLLGDSDYSIPATKERPFAGGLDVLHATSAALIDGTRKILLDSDFENAMKVLTSWIPVKDEELLMKVTKAEWKLHRGKKKN